MEINKALIALAALLGALAHAGIDRIVLAGASGESLADRVEWAALAQVFGSVPRQVSVGSVKSYMGHAEGASTLAQAIKLILEFQQEMRLPVSPRAGIMDDMRHASGSLVLAQSQTEWPKRPLPRRALVNAYGMGGAYGSLVVEGDEV